VERVVAELYRRIELDPELRPLFPDDLQAGRDNQILFFEQWLGGEARYTALRGSPRLKKRHQHFPIDEHTASRWLGHMADALRACQVDDATTEEILAALDPLARHFINQVPTGAG
jgi:hemoglobin